MTNQTLFPGLATAIGSLPYKDMATALDLVFAQVPDCPHWPQLQSRRYTEQMEIQPVEGLPGLRLRPDQKSVYVDTLGGEVELAEFYEKAMAAEAGGDLEPFAISADHAFGFHAFLERLGRLGRRSGLVKAQLIAPFSFGYSIHDQEGKPILYHPAWGEACMKLLALKSVWQVRKLRERADAVLFFLDEPMLAVYGSSAMVTVSREEVIERIDQVAGPLRAEGAIVGMHCCGNTDWGLVMETSLDVINFDAYNYGGSVALYPAETGRFLERGGWFAVGAIPTIYPDLDTIDRENFDSLTKRFSAWIDQMAAAGVDRELLCSRIILTPACGCGTLRVDQAEKIYTILARMSESFQSGLAA